MKIHYGAMAKPHTLRDERLHINLTILRASLGFHRHRSENEENENPKTLIEMMNGDQGAPLRFPISLSLRNKRRKTSENPFFNVPQKAKCCFHYEPEKRKLFYFLNQQTLNFLFFERMIVICLTAHSSIHPPFLVVYAN